MFDIESLQSNSETPTLIAILLAVSLCVVLSALITLTYDLTTKVSKKDHNYMQSLAMISILATMVMQAVGDSLARGLGMLGALAIIRFRTTLRDPRNMTFMFASLAVGISCGVFGFTIAVTGTIIFCVIAIILRFSAFGKSEPLVGVLKISMYAEQGRDTKKEFEAVLKSMCKEFILTDMRTRDKVIVLETEFNEFGKKIVTSSVNKRVKDLAYELHLRTDIQDTDLLDRFSELNEVQEVSLRFIKGEDKL
jgi:uncharacterized membrane protein YhiD involved in acid resistance